MPTVNHGAEEVIIWPCFAATGPEHLAVTDDLLLESNDKVSVQKSQGVAMAELKPRAQPD